jgi:hypothetical protein
MRTLHGLGFSVVCAAMWTCSTAVTATVAPRTALTVRVYESVGLSASMERRALAEAEIVLRSALVDVRWEPCSRVAPSEACSVPPTPGERLLSVREGAGCPDVSVTLGEALVIRDKGGMLATVFFDCVVWLATATRTDVAVLLGRVAAHELGHLMMHSTAHPRHGLMRPRWTRDEVRRNRSTDWEFTAEDVEAMRLRACALDVVQQ